MYIGTRIRVHTHTHTLLRFKRTHKLVIFIVMTGLCSVPDWRGEAFQKEMHRLEHNLPQAGSTHTVQSTHTEFGILSLSLVLKKKKKRF